MPMRLLSWIITKGGNMRVKSSVGEILNELFLQDLKITQTDLAKYLGVSFRTINEIVNNKRSLSVDMALRLARFFDTTPEFWLNAQNAYDISKADTSKIDKLKSYAEIA